MASKLVQVVWSREQEKCLEVGKSRIISVYLRGNFGPLWSIDNSHKGVFALKPPAARRKNSSVSWRHLARDRHGMSIFTLSFILVSWDAKFFLSSLALIFHCILFSKVFYWALLTQFNGHFSTNDLFKKVSSKIRLFSVIFTHNANTANDVTITYVLSIVLTIYTPNCIMGGFHFPVDVYQRWKGFHLGLKVCHPIFSILLRTFSP